MITKANAGDKTRNENGKLNETENASVSETS